MKFRELVNRYNDVKYRIKRLKLKEQELRELGGLPHKSEVSCGGGRSASAVEGYVVALNQIVCEIEQLESELVVLRERLTAVLDRLPSDNVREILEMRLLLRKTWRYIAGHVYYSESRVRQLYKIGLREVQDYEA